MISRCFAAAFLSLLLVLALSTPARAEEGHLTDRYFTLVDPDGRTVTRTSLSIGVGDSYIDEDNRLWEIVRIEDRTAHVEFREVVRLPRVTDALRAQAGRGEDGNPPVIGIYHSHNAESYVPTSGEAFREDGPGDVHKVGATLRDALQQQGVTVHWDQSLHLPHDGGAYQRSRATARELVQKGAVTVIDVHRDAIPAEEYLTSVNGEEMTKVRLVVGRQNANREANLEYAKQIKALADEEFPGLIKGIFHARGNYNQDMGPRMILLEFGTHETSLERARRSAELMAQIIPRAAGIEGQRRVGMGGWRSALWLAGIVIVGALAYLRINAGSWEAFFQRLRELFRLDKTGNR